MFPSAKKMTGGCCLVMMLLICLCTCTFTTLFGGLVQTTNLPATKGARSIIGMAETMAAHLHPGPSGYDVEYDSGFPLEALHFFQQYCPTCTTWHSGNLQCGMFVAAAYGVLGIQLAPAPAVLDWWTIYQHQSGWIETRIPQPGDIMMWSSSIEPAGHAAIVLTIRPPTRTEHGSITFANSTAIAPIVTQDVLFGGLVQTWQNYTVLGFIRQA